MSGQDVQDVHRARVGGQVVGLLAEFETVDALLQATEKVREEGFTRFDAHAPIPVHGLDEAMGIRATRLPWLVAAGGATGAFAGLALQWWTNAIDYPYMVAGKPLFGLPSAIPVTFEVTILLAALGAVIGLFAANRWPEHYHPLFVSERFRRASADRFFISIEALDPKYRAAKTAAWLDSLGASAVEEITEEREA